MKFGFSTFDIFSQDNLIRIFALINTTNKKRYTIFWKCEFAFNIPIQRVPQQRANGQTNKQTTTEVSYIDVCT